MNEIKIIQDAIAREGRVEGDHLVVPNDFFDRLGMALNPPGQRSTLDLLLDAVCKERRDG